MACRRSSSSGRPKRLLSRAADLDHDLQERYPSERLIEPFHERYSDEWRALRSRTTRDGEP